MLKKINIKIKGIHCKSCKSLIESEIEVLDGIKSIEVNNKSGKCWIEFDDNEISKERIFKTIKKLNYGIDEPEDTTNAYKFNFKKIIMPVTIIGVLAIGYFSFSFLGSDKSGSSTSEFDNKEEENIIINDGFIGERGINLKSKNNKVLIDELTVNDGNLHPFNYYSEKEGKNIYFFVLKAPDGTYRAAANACEVCYGSKKGFKQVGDLIRCENCRTTYQKSQIALQKGGCNPGPIDKNVQITNGQLEINIADVEAVSYLF